MKYVKKTTWVFDVRIPKTWQILKCFARSFYQAHKVLIFLTSDAVLKSLKYICQQYFLLPLLYPKCSGVHYCFSSSFWFNERAERAKKSSFLFPQINKVLEKPQLVFSRIFSGFCCSHFVLTQNTEMLRIFHIIPPV